jgi:hypothetical protein
MLTYITDNEYIELLDADSIPDNFNQLNIEASSYIEQQTLGKINKSNIPEQVKYATCLMINLLQEENTKLNEIGNLQSQNIEGWSETYLSPEEVKKNYTNKKQNILATYLWNITGIDGTPLLYKGVDVVG